MSRHSVPSPLSAGFSLIELMIAMVIGLAASIIIMQVFAFSEGQKRTSTGGADAQTNAAVSLYLLERDIRQAGYGLAPNTQDFVPIYTPPPAGVLTTGILAQCAVVRGHFVAAAGTTNYIYENSTFAPLIINPRDATGALIYPVGDTNTDVVLVNYSGTAGMTGSGIDVLQSGSGDADYTALTSRAGFNVGDIFIAVPPAASGNDCTVGQITVLPPASANVITHVSSTAGWTTPTTATAYAIGSRLYNLGPAGSFVSRAYAVRNGNLTMCDLTVRDCTSLTTGTNSNWIPIGSDIVVFRVQYGKDTDFNGTIDTWDGDAPTGTLTGTLAQPTGVANAQVVAARMIVVARSNQYEKAGDYTAPAPEWYADATGTAAITIDLSANTDWTRYRYKTVQSIVPLRNMMWGQQQ